MTPVRVFFANDELNNGGQTLQSSVLSHKRSIHTSGASTVPSEGMSAPALTKVGAKSRVLLRTPFVIFNSPAPVFSLGRRNQTGSVSPKSTKEVRHMPAHNLEDFTVRPPPVVRVLPRLRVRWLLYEKELLENCALAPESSSRNPCRARPPDPPLPTSLLSILPFSFIVGRLDLLASCGGRTETFLAGKWGMRARVSSSRGDKAINVPGPPSALGGAIS
jgi:hypothetical protein